jgi:3-hydroxyisobutyrate dehydrogenase-like beta-hydroxyacid dehydrogenase
MANLGFVGLGVMGSRMVKRLLDAGHTVTGYNRTESKAEWLLDLGMKWADTPRAAAEAGGVVFSMVSNTAALQAVTHGPDGVLAGLTPGMIYVDMSTVSPAVIRGLAAQVVAIGGQMLDAPVSGSVTTLEEGNIATNLSLAVQMLAFSEGVLLAEKSGIARKTAVEVLLNSVIASPMVKYRGPFVLGMPDEVLFDVNMMQKDLLLALEMGRELDVPLPTTAVTNQMLTAARGMGLAEKDFAAIFEVLSRMSGIKS